MYLINATTLTLERFDDESRIPPYAILSHTWSDSEVTFEQLSAVHWAPQDCLGLWKIQQTCIQALQDGLHYAWVDTCCIDKKSSAELSEAINSMFRWYEKATICYAFLGDVTAKHEYMEQLWKARWFTRGWTLQELIAPSTIVFYDDRWRAIGTKYSLEDELLRITGIGRTVLQRTVNLGTISIARKMSWAAKRCTTRAEDMAYCLLGIFDINMPLLYGEGDKAFVRLQEEIMKDSNDQSLFAWTPWETQGPVTRMVPAQWRSVFAKSPREFIFTTMIDLQQSHRTFALTNNGVRIQVSILPFIPASPLDDDWASVGLAPLIRMYKYNLLLLVLLECMFTSGEHQGCQVAIICECVDLEGLQLVRHCSAGLYPVDQERARKALVTEVFFMKKTSLRRIVLPR